MIDLERHIEILLLSNDCVIVPGFGGFMAHYVPSRYDDSDGTFLPPLRTLGFNPQLTMNDSLLAQSYVEAYDISYPEAVRRIESEVNELKQHLDSDGEYELNDIGMLKVNNEGNVLFRPCEAGILTPMLYGLSSFEMLATEKPQAASNTPQKAKKKAPKIAAVAQLNDPDSEQDSNKKRPIPNTITIKTAWLRNAFLAAAVIIAFLVIAPTVQNSMVTDRNLQTEASVLGISAKASKQAQKAEVSHNSVTTATTEATSQATGIDSETQKEQSEASLNEVTPATEEIQAETFAIVMASQVTIANAKSYVDMLHKKGYPLARVHSNGRINRVVYGSYNNANEAYNELRFLRGNTYFEEAWVVKLN